MKIKPFIYLFDKAILEHSAALIYPAFTSEDRNRNTRWIIDHYTNNFLEEETKMRDIYCLGLYHGQIPLFLELNVRDYNLFPSIRDKVISNYALGVSECELFENYPNESIPRQIIQDRVHIRQHTPPKRIIRSNQTRKMQINDFNFVQHLILPQEY